MSKTTVLVKDWLSNNLPKSFKAISEAVSLEGLTAFSEEMTELKSRMDAMEQGNIKLKEDFDAEKQKNTELESKLTGLEATKTDLQTKLTEAEADRNKYKEFYEEKTNAGNRLPKGDASDTAKNKTLANDHPMSIILSKAK